ncbi:MAG: lysophospholipid acyltransferase family protein [Chthoniobacterales bacterium]
MFEVGGAGQHAFNSSARTFFRVLFRVKTHIRIEHLAPIPSTGPLILASNHISHFDPPLVGAFFPRHVDWMAMEELFRNPRQARALELTGAFRVNRNGTDRTALRTATRRLKAGRVVGIFPEGGIRAGATSILERAPMRPGLAALALLAEAPVIPSIIVGTDRLYHKRNWLPFRRPPVWIVTGALIPAEGEREALHERIASAFVELQNHLLSQPGFRAEDLPLTPQARKGEDPYAP